MSESAAPSLGFPARMLLTCFGLGLLKPAPGTWGSLPPVVLALMLVLGLGSRSDAMNFNPALLVNGALLLVLLVFSCACLKFGSTFESNVARKDPSQVVADEVAGQSLALLLLPWHWTSDARGVQYNIMLAASSFLLFRLLDIIKPPPARGLQRIKGGAGILIDDLICAAYANLLLQGAAHFFVRTA